MSELAEADTMLDIYRRWERQQWAADDIDFAVDRDQWLRLSDNERWQWFWLAGFSHYHGAELAAVNNFARLLPTLQRKEQQIVLSTQIADEGRHSYFFGRFSDEVTSRATPPVLQGQTMMSAPYKFLVLDFPDALTREAAANPNPATAARVVFQIFIVLEGTLAIASFQMVRQLLTKTGLFPGLLEGLTLILRDEVRHVQIGTALLKDTFGNAPAAREAVTACLHEMLPALSQVMTPRPERAGVLQSLGLNPYERRKHAFELLRRSLKTLEIDDSIVIASQPIEHAAHNA